jgi:CheY-like chemotaxis protein
MRILWIDDEIELLKPYIYLLTEKGYEVMTASNGPDGLELLKKFSFDLVFLDEMMIGMDGLAVLERLKAQDPSTIVVMVTKVNEEELMNKAFSQLVDDYIIKPFNFNQILAVLKRVYEKKILIGERIKQEFLQIIRTREVVSDWRDWINYYLMLLNWQSMIERFGDEVIKESFKNEKLASNTEFAQYIEYIYPQWLSGSDGPILSHQFFKHFILPYIKEKPVCFILFDSMTAAQWIDLSSLLKEFYEIKTQYYFSILPTATAYARNAIFSGMLPLEIFRKHPQFWVFEDTGQNRYEEELLARQLANLIPLKKLMFFKTSRNDDLLGAESFLLSGEYQFVAIILNFLDTLIHSIRNQRLLEEIAGDEHSLAGLTKVWFSGSEIYRLLQKLQNKNYLIIITSDHGFIKVNRPTLIYGGRELSANLRYKYGGGIRVDEKAAVFIERPENYMLPSEHRGTNFAIAKSDYYFIYPTKPKEYEESYKSSYQHGGISLDEMILPVAFLEPRK